MPILQFTTELASSLRKAGEILATDFPYLPCDLNKSPGEIPHD